MEIKDFDVEKVQDLPIVVYGAGLLGSLVYQQLVKSKKNVIAFCDALKFGNKLHDVDIWHPSQLLKNKKEIIVILTVMGNGFFSVAINLKKSSVKIYTSIALLDNVDYAAVSDIKLLKQIIENKYKYVYGVKRYELYTSGNKSDDLLSERTLPAWDTGDIKNFHSMTLVITDRCTLKCKECGALAPYFKNPKDTPLIDIIDPFRKILKCIDYIENLVIVGGETFLYKDLEDLLTFCASCPQVVSITLPTNGTVMPSDKMLKMLQSLHIEVMISIYDLPQCRGDEVYRKLLSYGIKAIYRNDSHWFSVQGGIPNNFSDEELREMYSTCGAKTCWCLKRGKLSPCGYAVTMDELRMAREVEQDYIDFNQFETMDIDDIKRQIEKLLSVPYLKSCFYCKGNTIPINKVAEQLK